MGTHRIPLSNAETDTFLTVPAKLDELSAPTDVSTLNVSTSAHGLCPKLPNDASKYLDGAGNYTAPTTFGTTEGTFCEGDDSRLSNSRPPTSHSTSHKSGGADSIKLDELSTPTDVTTLNASTTTHGLCPKGTITGIKYLKNDITWDEITLDECASPSDNTNLNASTNAHGLCPKGSNTGTKFLRDDITWTVINIDGGSP
jgi:hypothetical protein